MVLHIPPASLNLIIRYSMVLDHTLKIIIYYFTIKSPILVWVALCFVLADHLLCNVKWKSMPRSHDIYRVWSQYKLGHSNHLSIFALFLSYSNIITEHLEALHESLHDLHEAVQLLVMRSCNRFILTWANLILILKVIRAQLRLTLWIGVMQLRSVNGLIMSPSLDVWRLWRYIHNNSPSTSVPILCERCPF